MLIEWELIAEMQSHYAENNMMDRQAYFHDSGIVKPI